MAHKIRVKYDGKEKKYSTQDLIPLILGILLLIAGPLIYRFGLISNFINVDFSLTFLYTGILVTCIGLGFILMSKAIKYNKLLASILCFYAAVNSFLLIETIAKLKIAAHNIIEVYIEVGIEPANPNMEANVAQMDVLNEVSIILFVFLGVIFLILHIFRKDIENTELPPEIPPPRSN